MRPSRAGVGPGSASISIAEPVRGATTSKDIRRALAACPARSATAGAWSPGSVIAGADHFAETAGGQLLIHAEPEVAAPGVKDRITPLAQADRQEGRRVNGPAIDRVL